MDEKGLSVYEFVDILIKSLNIKSEADEVMAVARKLGIIEDYDITHKDSPIQRRAAARIIHSTLINYLKEKDLVDWSAAEVLKDLYDCHTCVNNIAQVYSKGIMDTTLNGIFDVYGNVTEEESNIYFSRMINNKLRKSPDKGKPHIYKVIEEEEAGKKLREDSRAKLIDVRSAEDYSKWHMTDSINIMLSEINKNPFIAGDNRDNCVMLYCNKGYQSRLAANLLINAGYKDVYVVKMLGSKG